MTRQASINVQAQRNSCCWSGRCGQLGMGSNPICSHFFWHSPGWLKLMTFCLLFCSMFNCYATVM